MILAGLDATQSFAAVLTVVAAVLGSYAAVVARRTEGRSATREETQQALEAQDNLLDRYERRIGVLEARCEVQDKKIEDALARAMTGEQAHRECERKLEMALLEIDRRLPPS